MVVFPVSQLVQAAALAADQLPAAQVPQAARLFASAAKVPAAQETVQVVPAVAPRAYPALQVPQLVSGVPQALHAAAEPVVHTVSAYPATAISRITWMVVLIFGLIINWIQPTLNSDYIQ
jgi:hypothetical protein